MNRDANSRGTFHLTWIGPTDGQCASLLARVDQTCSRLKRRLRVHAEPLDSPLLASALQACDSPVTAWADRVIIACETRLDYPWRVIEELERLDAGVPWGVVTSCWHAGSRRTGIGPAAHWQLPWYRWWDGWYGWLFPELARPTALCPTQFEPVTMPIDLATPASRPLAGPGAPFPDEPILEVMPGPARQILIVAACAETSQAWQLMVARVGWDSLVQHPQQTAEAMAEQRAAAPNCILWDDSSQDRLPGGGPPLQQACRQIEWLKRSYPRVPIVAAVSLAHLSAWMQLQRAGASDFIVKPSFGLPLADFLNAEMQREQRAQR